MKVALRHNNLAAAVVKISDVHLTATRRLQYAYEKNELRR